MSELFTIPVGTAGSFTCTSPAPRVYLLTFSSPPDNRLSNDFISAFSLSLDLIEKQHPPGVLITTSSSPKFYSNGLDLSQVAETPDFFPGRFYPLLARVLTFPMPTIALLNGHAFAGGLILAMHHDYRVMARDRGFLCVNEILFGAVMDAPLLSIFRDKLASPAVFRDLVLEAKRFGGPAALEAGLVDAVGGLDVTLKLVQERGLTTKAESGIYGIMKEQMWRNSMGFLADHEGNVRWRREVEGRKAEAGMSFAKIGKMQDFVAAQKAKGKGTEKAKM